MKKTKLIRTVIMGILQEYRGRGFDLALVTKTIEKGTALGYQASDCSLIVENNLKMIQALEIVKAKIYKTWRIYRKTI